MFDPEKFGQSVGDAIRAAVAPLRDEIEQLKAQIAAMPEPKDGKDADMDAVRALVLEEVGKAEYSIDEAAVKRLVDDSVGAAVELIPAPKDGASVTVDDVAPLIDDAVKSAVDAIPKPENGTSVTIDDVRPLVDDAVKSAVDKIVLPEPISGEDGRDALALEILPTIDTDKSYPRGTYATHKGGLWRSYETTFELRGWECIQDGIADLNIEQTDERVIVINAALSSGKSVRKEISMPVVIDRGVYKQALDIKAGDGVTWGGSYWIAQANNPTGKPGEVGSDGWRLAVKRGRDGRDGKNGIDRAAPVEINK